MYDGEQLAITKLKVDLPDSEESLEDVEESRLKMKDKMIQLDYEKLKALYDSFVPQTGFLVEQTFFSSPSTSNKNFESMEKKVEKQSQKDESFQNEIDRLLEVSLEREIRDCVLSSVEKPKNEMLMLEKELISNESRGIQATMLQQIKILENDFKRAETQYINLELKMQHQKEKNACDVSWKSKMAQLNGENVSLNIQLKSLV
ncbi:hypothetical protein Tco_0843318 [Tanacetum coccineum]|uniref:Uncharacterized protein n=1 Tax=Tanacetum coccineum TaxID=301880 RepID=A0ABQ5B1Q8_9ASTR